MTATPKLVLGLHPSYRGLGWILFEGPEAPFDWGTADIRRAEDMRTLLRAAELFDRFQPAVLVLEDFESGRRAPRIRVLGRAIVARAELRNIAVHRFDRAQIRAVLHPARSRHAVAAAVAARIKPLAPYLPRKRKPWETERLNLALFCAAACAVTYYAHAA
jgi:hypothetical protein